MNRFPLFKLNFNNKTSYLLGTNHWCSLIKLDENVRNIIINQKNLIVESNIPFYTNKIPLSYESAINNFKYNIEYYPIHIKKNHIRSSFNLNIMKHIDSYSFHEIINNLVSNTPFIINQASDLNSKFISSILVKMFYLNGVDHQLVSLYRKNDKKIFHLDNTDDPEYIEKTSLLLEKLEKSIRMNLYIYLITKKFKHFDDYWHDLIRDTSFDYLYKDYFELIQSHKEGESDDFILGKRNDIWVPKIIKHHEQLESPLFMVGYGHLCGKYNLFDKIKNNQYVKDFQIEIFDRINRKFMKF